MKCVKASKPSSVSVDVEVPNDAAFRIIRTVLDDLEVCTSDHQLFAAIRGRNVEKLLGCISRYDARSIIGRLSSTPADVSTFAKLYQVGALIKKYPFQGLDTFSPALKKFLQCEERCRLFNTQNYRALLKLSKAHPDFYGVVEDLRKEIYGLIGDAPDIESVYVNGLHGPGQSAGGLMQDGKVTEYFKYTTIPYTVSANARTHAIAAISSDPRWIGGLMDLYRESNSIPKWEPISMGAFWDYVLKVQDFSEITSVPKTALIDRFIAMEPVMNVFLQLGVDRVLREKLLESWGYDLNDQRKNQELAKEGSIYNTFATLDLVGASDTIALLLVFLLFPAAWVDLLIDLRMAKGRIKKTNTEITFSKLSSMGNGYTFAIESIIFGACTRVAMKRSKCMGKSAVYGDDIVCPSGAVNLLVSILNLCGFEVNSEKSFTEGPFRESCGADFYLGHNVRPLFITKAFGNVPSLFHLVNSFKVLEERWEWPYGHTFKRTISQLLTWIPPYFRTKCRGPRSESTDTHLFCDEPLQSDRRGYRFFFRLVERPLPYKPRRLEGYRTFHLRKLMAKLQPSTSTWWDFLFVPERPIEKWDWRKKFDRGNVFDITRRGHTYHRIVRSYLPEKWQ